MDKCRQYSKRESAGITFFILKRVFGDVMRVKKLDACISSDNTQSVCVQQIDIFSCSVYSSPKTIILLLDLYEILPPSKYLLYCVITFCNSFENHSRFACLFTCNGH